jgi:hypothetical protein
MKQTDFMSQEELKEKLFESEGWMIFRYEPEKGIYFHYKDEKSIYLLPMFLATNEKMWEFVNKSIEEIKQQNNDASIKSDH